MIDPTEKSTRGSAAPGPPGAADAAHGRARIAPEVFLDGRLAIVHEGERWMAASDMHFGYEVSRRAAGGLWPLWGMHSIRERLASLIEDWKPERLILVGDVVDGAAAPDDAIEWLESIRELGPELVLVEGNHDRGAIRRHFSFRGDYRTGAFYFHHGHRLLPRPEGARVVVTGHLHPSIRYHDGAGTALRLPAFTREQPGDGGEEIGGEESWVLPAFSPWAGGHPSRPGSEESRFRRWVCGGRRVFEMDAENRS